MEAIFHELQEGSLCAQHCLNTLLQGQYFGPTELADLANLIDEQERVTMAEMGESSSEYNAFINQPSSNMDDTGFFSIQVLSRALAVWDLDIVPYLSSDPMAKLVRENPTRGNAFICNYRQHWFTIRKIGKQWFNLNSLLTGPELVSDSYLALFLTQLQQEGYDIFIVKGKLPDCEADRILDVVDVVQTVKPTLLHSEDKPESKFESSLQEANQFESEEDQLQAALAMSLANLAQKNEEKVNTDATMNDIDLERAVALSLQDDGDQKLDEHDSDGEEDLKKAIELSLKATSSHHVQDVVTKSTGSQKTNNVSKIKSGKNSMENINVMNNNMSQKPSSSQALNTENLQNLSESTGQKLGSSNQEVKGNDSDDTAEQVRRKRQAFLDQLQKKKS